MHEVALFEFIYPLDYSIPLYYKCAVRLNWVSLLLFLPDMKGFDKFIDKIMYNHSPMLLGFLCTEYYSVLLKVK